MESPAESPTKTNDTPKKTPPGCWVAVIIFAVLVWGLLASYDLGKDKPVTTAEMLSFQADTAEPIRLSNELHESLTVLLDAYGKGQLPKLRLYEHLKDGKQANEGLVRRISITKAPGMLKRIGQDIETAFYLRAEAYGELMKALDDNSVARVSVALDKLRMAADLLKTAQAQLRAAASRP